MEAAGQGFEVGDRVEAKAATGQWLPVAQSHRTACHACFMRRLRRGTIVDVVLRQTSTPSQAVGKELAVAGCASKQLKQLESQVKVHFDSTVYKSDEWINTQRLAALGTNTEDPADRSAGETSAVPGAAGARDLKSTT